MAKSQRRPYKGPNYARDPRIKAAVAHTAPALPTPSAHAFTGPSRLVRAGRWGAGGAVGLAAVEVTRRNRKVKKMDVSKAADIPFKGVRTFAAPKGTKKPGQLPFWEHYSNPSASPRQLGVQRFTGTKGNRTGRLVEVHKALRPVGLKTKPNVANKRKGQEYRQTRLAMQEGAGTGVRFGMQQARAGRSSASIPGSPGQDRGFDYGLRAGFLRSKGVSKADIIPTRVTSVQPRLPNGKWVGRANDLQVFTPQNKGKGRRIHSSALEHYTRVKKAEERVSGQRRGAAAVGGWLHPVIAGKKGQKLNAWGSTVVHGAAGGIGGRLIGTALTRGKGGTSGGQVTRGLSALAGGQGGLQVAVTSNQRKGRLKNDYRNAGPQGTGVKKSLFGGGEETSLALSGTIGMGSFAQNQGRRGQRF